MKDQATHCDWKAHREAEGRAIKQVLSASAQSCKPSTLTFTNSALANASRILSHP